MDLFDTETVEGVKPIQIVFKYAGTEIPSSTPPTPVAPSTQLLDQETQVVEQVKQESLPDDQEIETDEMPAELQRQLRQDDQATLFEIEEAWRDDWWGMPAYEIGDARPRYKITMNFMTADDVMAFAKKTGLNLNIRSNSAWFPEQGRLSGGKYFYGGPKTDSKYPVCIPSKGRAAIQKTGKVLDGLGVSYKFFVEETEYEDYCRHIGEPKVVKMPFHDLGQGSIPARNFIWEWAKERGHKRHWTVDDNIKCFVRCHNNRRLIIRGGGLFRAMEDFVDRYDNIAMAGPHHVGFVPDREPSTTPFLLNSRVYSCILLDTSLPHRWRGRYNEDTDLSLRLLKEGYCTLLFRALCMNKETTVGAKGAKPMAGGNTDNVYNTGDHRRAFAESLKEQHPDCVDVVWRFNRWHHLVDYSQFKRNKLKMKPNITPTASMNEYGMELVCKDASDNGDEL